MLFFVISLVKIFCFLRRHSKNFQKKFQKKIFKKKFPKKNFQKKISKNSYINFPFYELLYTSEI